MLPLTLVIGGCSGDAGSETGHHPYYVRGRKLMRQDNIQQAEQAFQRCLLDTPTYKRAHLQLGLIYQDHREDPLAAAYHYSAFLNQAEEDDPKREVARKWLAEVRSTYVKDVVSQNPDRYTKTIEEIAPQDVAEDKQERTSEKPSSKTITPRERRLAERVKSLKTRLIELRQKQTDATAQTRETQQPSPTAEKTGSDVPEDQQALPTEPQQEEEQGQTRSSSAETYVVKDGDTLYGICKRKYGEGELWNELKEHNDGLFEDADKLAPGMELQLPPVQELRKNTE